MIEHQCLNKSLSEEISTVHYITDIVWLSFPVAMGIHILTSEIRFNSFMLNYFLLA